MDTELLHQIKLNNGKTKIVNGDKYRNLGQLPIHLGYFLTAFIKLSSV
jgi:hypothetical protein